MSVPDDPLNISGPEATNESLLNQEMFDKMFSTQWSPYGGVPSFPFALTAKFTYTDCDDTFFQHIKHPIIRDITFDKVKDTENYRNWLTFVHWTNSALLRCIPDVAQLTTIQNFKDSFYNVKCKAELDLTDCTSAVVLTLNPILTNKQLFNEQWHYVIFQDVIAKILFCDLCKIAATGVNVYKESNTTDDQNQIEFDYVRLFTEYSFPIQKIIEAICKNCLNHYRDVLIHNDNCIGRRYTGLYAADIYTLAYFWIHKPSMFNKEACHE